MSERLRRVLAEIEAAARGSAGIAGETSDAILGAITLRPHQLSAVRRLRAALAEFGGALLADAPGLGKTYVALAVAARYNNVVVVAPAALRSLWRDAAERAGSEISFMSVESLSRRPSEQRPAFVIVDEAHHVHHTGTARYRHLANLTAGATLLLLSATPVKNRRSELYSLLALFLGTRAATLDKAALARCTVVRGAASDLLPLVVPTVWHRLVASPSFSAAIGDLPPPLPVRDGREARAILAMGLTRAWASSLAALYSALTHRLQRGAALDAALELGRMPTRAELAHWVVGDDAVQLALPFVVATACDSPAAMRETVRAHLAAVRALREQVEPHVRDDCEARAVLVRELRGRHFSLPVVAFSGYAATVDALFRALRRDAGVVALTSRGARSASGPRPRADVIAALGSERPRDSHDTIDIVLTTDLLSEGVNLQAAGVIVHLDIPWTPAALEQRVGRAARMESRHTMVFVHGIAPPPDAEQLLGTKRRHDEKRSAATQATAAGANSERLLSATRSWRGELSSISTINRKVEPTPQSAVSTSRIHAGYFGVVEDSNGRWLVGGTFERGVAAATRDPSLLAELAESVGESPLHETSGTEAPVIESPGGESPGGESPETTVDLLAAAAARAVRRFMRASAIRRALDAAPSGDGARRALLTRTDRIVADSPPHRRAELAGLAASVRAAAAAAVGAGAEQQLWALTGTAGLADLGGSDWLRHAAEQLERVARVTQRSGPVASDWRLRALLLLIPAAAALPAPVPPAPTSAAW